MCKKAVIGSRIGSTQCVIEDGVDGVLVSPGNAGDLGIWIRRVGCARDIRERLGRRGYAKTMAHFTWDKVTDKMEDIYRRAHLAACHGSRCST